MTFLYHGSFVSVPSPLTGVGRRELDFGPGFYVTNIREQAERWARRVCVVRAADTPNVHQQPGYHRLLPAFCCHRNSEERRRTMRDQVLWRKEGRIAAQLAARLSIDAERALDILYNSHTYELLVNPDSGLQLQSDDYILTDLLRELEINH